jgi:N-acetylglucosamine malate deacetylase 1
MRIAVFSAHPDDAEFAMGGVLLMLARQHDVTNVILTRGEAGTHGTPQERESEAYEAGRIGGYRVRFLKYTDTLIEDTATSVTDIAGVIRELAPRVIFTTYHTNNASHLDGRAHQDHTSLGRIVRKAARIAKFKNAMLNGTAHRVERIIYYMVPRYAKPSFIVDVSSEAETLPRLWKAHASQTALKEGTLIKYLIEQRHSCGADAGIGSGEPFIIEEPLVMPDVITTLFCQKSFEATESGKEPDERS